MVWRATPNAPASWESADCLEQGVYYIIPIWLWELVERAVGVNHFSDEARRRETEIATAAEHYQHAAAIRNGGFVSYSEIFPLDPVILNEEAAASLGMTPVQARLRARQLTGALEETTRPLRAYLGWLLTNPEFLEEHDALCSGSETELERNPFPVPRRSSQRLPGTGTPADEAVGGCLEFYSRWRLQSFTLPLLPRPLPVEMPAIFDPVRGAAPVGVAVSLIPDIFPNRSRDVIGDCTESMLRGCGAPKHLSDWFAIVERQSTRANVLPKYARWLSLQHYWRLLHRRYPLALHRKKERLVGVFAEFLDVSPDTVEADLRGIEGRLGSGWEQRGAARP